MAQTQTTALALDTRAQKYVDANPTDSVATVNRLIDKAVRLQDEGRFAEADAMLAEAEALL